MDLELFHKMLSYESTSGLESGFAYLLKGELGREFGAAISKGGLDEDLMRVRLFEMGDGTANLLFTFGEPEILYCTHLDTVPPYIAPEIVGISKGFTLPDGTASVQDDVLITGRGSCDAKGQIMAMTDACCRLLEAGCSGFGLLLLAGEETGSFGAKAYMNDNEAVVCGRIVVGEPTDNECVCASKGTKSFQIEIVGQPCHSGYPHLGHSAVEDFVDFMNRLRGLELPVDPVLGETTYNVGKLSSPNPQNILSGHLSFRLYFRTTFASDAFVSGTLASWQNESIHIEALGGDDPMSYTTYKDIPEKTVSFGSDAPRLYKFAKRSLCGPGSIFVAHTDREYILLSDLERASAQYISIYHNK